LRAALAAQFEIPFERAERLAAEENANRQHSAPTFNRFVPA
jgi:hypothetical protein